MALRRRLLGPRTVTLVDQVLSSVSNVLAVLLVARAVDKADFGRFALGYAILTLVLTLSRSYFGTRVSLARDKETARRLTAAIAGSLVMLSPIIIAVVFAVSVVTAGTSSLALLAIVALATPVVLVQDIIRAGSAASNEPWAALLSDAVWVAVMAVPFVLQLKLSSSEAMGLWGVAALAALLVAMATYRVRPQLRAGSTELRTRHAMGESVTLGAIFVNVSVLTLLAVVARAMGPAAAGSLRGAATTMGPVNVLINFAGLGLTPALVRRSRSQDKRFCSTTAVVTMALTAAWSTVLLVMPHSVGVKLFHDSWDGIRHVLPITAVEYVLTCVTTAAILGLKVRGETRAFRRLRLVSASVTLVGGTTCALTFSDVRAVSVALALSAGSAGAVGWWGLLASRPEVLAMPLPTPPAVNVLPV